MASKGTVNMQSSEPIKQPLVFIGVPIGPSKLYSTYYMVASLANLNYPNVELHWAVTGADDDPRFNDYRDRLTKLCEAVRWPEGWRIHIHYIVLTKERRFTNYGPILDNKTALRNLFLDSEAEYFLLLGGDNPPPRNAIQKLMAVDAGVAMGTCYQRPEQTTSHDVYPLVWRYVYTLAELDKADVDPANRELMRQSWLNSPATINVSYDPKWKDNPVIWDVCGGDGCALIKRAVLEAIDWGVTPPDSCSCSEDMHFMSQALYYGFSTACLPNLHIAHMAENGMGV